MVNVSSGSIKRAWWPFVARPLGGHCPEGHIELGERERGTTRLEEAVEAFRDALMEWGGSFGTGSSAGFEPNAFKFPPRMRKLFDSSSLHFATISALARFPKVGDRRKEYAMRKLLFATAAAAALVAAVPASAQVVYADPHPGIGVQIGPFGFGVGPRYGWHRYAYDCPLVREQIVTAYGRVIYRTHHECY